MTTAKKFVKKYPNGTFWSILILLNLFLFLPVYLFFREQVSFWPLADLENATRRGVTEALLLQRDNVDIFRLNVELLLLAFLWVFVPRLQRPFFVVAAFLLYLAQLGYAVYEGFVRSYYLLEPIFYNDFLLFTNGTAYTLQSLKLPGATYLLGLLAVGGLLWLLWGLHQLLFTGVEAATLGLPTRVALVGLLLLAGTAVLLNGEERGSMTTAVSSFTARLTDNIGRSRISYAEARRFDTGQLLPYYQFTENDLRHKPNIYLIFIESYGSVLYQRSDYLPRYHTLLKELDAQLAATDWQVTSNRSNAPTWGGGSWISYTSALTGLRLDSHTQYLAFLNRYHNQSFPHLFNYLRSQGYRSYRLSGMADELNEIEWQRYKDFYGVDEWLRFSDVAYDGPLYGWGPALPDQYAINYAHDIISSHPDVPAVFFYISQNSHYPWSPLPEIAQDWRALNDLPPAEPIQAQSHPELRRHYFDSIAYELEMLVDFIIREGDENDIFVLMGDHQPSRVARYADGWDTPVHIFSQDAALIESFHPFGFVPGLDTRTIEPSMYHEGFYSLFSRILLQQYGVDPTNVPDYMPNGFPLN